LWYYLQHNNLIEIYNMVNNSKSNRIYNEYLFVSLICILSLVTLSISFCIYFYFIEKDQLYTKIKSSTVSIEKTTTESFNYTSQLVRFIGSSIVEQAPLNEEKIAGILGGKLVANAVAKDLFSFTIFDWVSSEKKIIISGPYGILKEPKDASFRNYAKMADKEPWKLHLDHPDYGVPSGQFILPAGMGITSNDGSFLGIISMGFNLSNFNKAIKSAINDDRIKYTIIFTDNTQLLQSDDAEKLPVIDPNNFTLGNNRSATQLPQNIKSGNNTYVYYKKFNDYPLIAIVGYSEEALYAELYQKLFPRIIELLSLGAISIIMLFIMRKKIVSPIVELSNIADRISKGETKLSIPHFRTFEMNNLAHQLNNVISYTKQLYTANNSLEQKVAERTEELEIALKAKTEFLNNMSHEVRTPITGVEGISQGLVDNWDKFNDAERLDFAKKVASNATRLRSLVGNLLDLSKFTAGKMILDFKNMNLNESVHSMIDEVQELYLQNKPISFKFNESFKASIVADSERISQVMRNLFVNAIKFSPADKDSTITASLEKTKLGDKDAILFRLSDEGVGVPENELEAIFDPFTQSTKTKTRAGGTGLGLSICKEIIEAHGGKIWAENNKKVGASFSFIIPAQMDENNEHAFGFKPAKPKKEKPTILMIDDEDSCLTTMSMILMSSNYNVIKADGGIKGLEILKEKHEEIDIVLVDLMMPDMYGLDVLKVIKAEKKYSRIPVILQTGTSEQKELDKAKELGSDGYIKKPYIKDSVLLEIASKLN